MKIGIACFPTYGGSGALAAELAIAMAARGHRVHLFSYAPPFRLSRAGPRLVFHEVEAFQTPSIPQPLYTLDLASKIAVVAQAEGLEILHAHYAVPHSAAAILARDIVRPRRLRVVTTLHGTDITLVGSHPAYRPVVRWSILGSDAATAVSRDLARSTRRILSLACPIAVTPNFVDLARFRPSPSREGSAGAGRPFTIAHVSNFRPVKRVGDILHAFRRILDARPRREVRLVLAGDGPDLPLARDLARTLGVDRQVDLPGRVDAVESLLAEADLLMLASETESFGLSALEAMAAGLPVVATDAGGIREVVAHGRTGFLVPVADPAALARAALALARNPRRARAFGIAGRSRAERLFSLERGVRRYEAIYRKVLSGRVRRCDG